MVLLKVAQDIEERITILEKINIFEKTSIEGMRKIAENLEKVYVQKKERIFSIGETGDAFYIVLDGEIRIHDKNDYSYSVIRKNQYFGDYALLDSTVRAASATAMVDTEMLRISRSSFVQLMAGNINIMRGVISSLIEKIQTQVELEKKIEKRNRILQQQKEEIRTQHDALSLQHFEIEKQRDQIVVKNTMLEEQTEEITVQRNVLAKNQSELRSSIHYAENIQKALLPIKKKIKKSLPESFVFYRPKDIVSGDFYWFKKTKNRILLAAGDSTGHGIPGAFMSILGISALDQIVKKSSFDDVSKILTKLRKKIKKFLHQNTDDSVLRDGMDMAICSINLEEMQMQFAGAFRPLYLIRKGELIEYKGDRQPISVYVNEKKFTKHSISLQKDDVFYIFSDGYVDQFGGEQKKKMKIVRFKELLLQISHLSMKKQHKKIEEYMEKWQQNMEQVDDMLIIGFRF